MVEQKLVEDIVREVIKSMYQESAAAPAAAPAPAPGLSPERDYPLAAKRPELVKTPSGKPLTAITLEKVLNSEIGPDDVRITPQTLRMQAEIAEGVGRTQFAQNLRRAAELTAIPDNRILEIYNALRPYRSTKQELLDIAGEMETKYNARINASFVREAAEVYERRNRLKAE
ncbi:MAG TPA: diol dehydratase small subunit [Selenomonadales bacterium]|nr:diol dehydratase small subunit [Selenomonadales bacterium]